MTIKIHGAGCANCEKLESLARQAVAELGIQASFEKVKDIEKILEYGIARTPGLVIDEVVKSSGRIPSLDEIKIWIEKEKQDIIGIKTFELTYDFKSDFKKRGMGFKITTDKLTQKCEFIKLVEQKKKIVEKEKLYFQKLMVGSQLI